MKRLAALALVVVLSSCVVSSKKYNNLIDRYAKLEMQHEADVDRNTSLQTTNNSAYKDAKKLKANYENAVAERDKYRTRYFEAAAKYKNMKLLYESYAKSNASTLTEADKDNIDVVYRLASKEQKLLQNKERLEQDQQTLSQDSKRVVAIERLIQSRKPLLVELKDTLSVSFNSFLNNKFATLVQERDEVVLTISNDILFKPRTWNLLKDGEYALELLGTILVDYPKTKLEIISHTDNVPFEGKTSIPFINKVKDNWDLSTKRASVLANYLKDKTKINKQKLYTSGRGELEPIATNETVKGKTKNRRTIFRITMPREELIKLITSEVYNKINTQKIEK